MMPPSPAPEPANGYPCRVLLTDRAEQATTAAVADTVHLPVRPYRGLGVALPLDDGQHDLAVTAACPIGPGRYLITLDLRTPAEPPPGAPT